MSDEGEVHDSMLDEFTLSELPANDGPNEMNDRTFQMLRRLYGLPVTATREEVLARRDLQFAQADDDERRRRGTRVGLPDAPWAQIQTAERDQKIDVAAELAAHRRRRSLLHNAMSQGHQNPEALSNEELQSFLDESHRQQMAALLDLPADTTLADIRAHKERERRLRQTQRLGLPVDATDAQIQAARDRRDQCDNVSYLRTDLLEEMLRLRRQQPDRDLNAIGREACINLLLGTGEGLEPFPPDLKVEELEEILRMPCHAAQRTSSA